MSKSRGTMFICQNTKLNSINLVTGVKIENPENCYKVRSSFYRCGAGAIWFETKETKEEQNV